jgi:hypothetical protein
MPGSREHGALVVRDTVQRFRLMAFLCGVTGLGGRGQGQEQPALPRSAGLWCCPGDKMIDWASPACGDAAAQSESGRPPGPVRAGRQRLTADWRELAAVVPISE